MLDNIASALEKLGIYIEETVAIGRYAVLKVRLSSGREAIAKIPGPCIEDSSSRECRERSRDLELETGYLLRIRSNNVAEFIELVDVGLAKILIRGYADTTLRDVIVERKLTRTRVLEIARDIALALSDVHRAGFVYTDLKPENIGVDNNKKIVLLDFDSLTPPFAKPKSITYDYAPPEYLSDGIVVYESDVYQLALVVLEMIFGEHVNNPTTIVDDIEDEALESLLKSMLSLLPFTRPRPRDIIYKLDLLQKPG